MAMCTLCSNAFEPLYLFYTEFSKLSSQMSYLQQLISATSGWVDRQIHQDFSKKISNELKKEVIHQPSEGLCDIPDLFVSSYNSENDWATSNVAKSEDGDDLDDQDYINESKWEVTGESSMKTRRMSQNKKCVTVSIEPLQLEKLGNLIVVVINYKFKSLVLTWNLLFRM